jgi:acid phosphatase
MHLRRLLGVMALAAVAACSSSTTGGGPSTGGPPTSSPPATSTSASSTLASSSTASASKSSTSTTSTGLPKFAHVLVVVEENHGYGQIIGSPSAPYINSLVRSGTLLTNSYAITHPSEPNYVALFSGSTHGLTSDACPNSYSGPDLYSALHAVGRHFTGYSEGLPSAGSKVCRLGKYARKHVPWTNFSDVPASANQPLTAFPSDFSRLSSVTFVIPNLNDDMHDGTIAQGDSWLKQHLSRYISWARTHNSLFVLTYDEDETHEGNRIPTLFVGAHLKAGSRYGGKVDHYTVLRTIEDIFGTQHVGQSASRAPIKTIWT